MNEQNRDGDKEIDILVVGSGAGGLLAAIAAADRQADVLVIEKSDEYGGTSATSGGGIWIPNSHLAAAAGQQDTPEDAFAYIRSLSAPNVPDENIHAYIRWAPLMLRFVHDHTPVRYASLPYTDYHAELPGGKLGYRTHLPIELDGRLLGKDMNTLRSASPAASLFGLINWTFTETYALLFRPKGWVRGAAKMLARYYLDIGQRLHSRKDRFLTLGTALVGGLRVALNERKVPLWLNSPMIELVVDAGRVVGAVVKHQGKNIRIRTRKGVILAAGGFERSAELRAKYLRGSADPRLSGSQINNTGDSILAATAVGAATMNMQSTWSAPVFSVPGEASSRLSTIERALPGCIIVNQAGKRYMNEAASYHVVGRIMIETDQPGAGTNPSWVIFDATFRHKYPMGPLLPLIPDWLQSKGTRLMLKKAATIKELAIKIGAPPDALASTVERFNIDARKGVDTEFDRGGPAYDRLYGDARVTPNPTLAPIVTAPFYAMPIYGGDIGTNGGLVTDRYARVLDGQGQPISGLYACGNNAASVMGESYPGAGATLGPAMTFGYVAARHLTGAAD
jgi:3-oxosteroid 1-dehydrogenase